MIYETTDNQLYNLSQMRGIYIEQHGKLWKVVVNYKERSHQQSLYTTEDGWKAQIAYEYIRDAYKIGLTLISHAEIEQVIESQKDAVYCLTMTSTIASA